MTVRHASPPGWSKRTHRLFQGLPDFPLAALATLIFGTLHIPFFVEWACCVQFGERMWDYWRAPLVAGFSPVAVLLVLDGLLGAWLLGAFVRRLRRPWRRDRVVRVVCLAGFGNLVLLTCLHLALAAVPSQPFPWHDRAIWVDMRGEYLTVTVRRELVPDDLAERLQGIAAAVEEKGGAWGEYTYTVTTPHRRLAIPLRDFDLVLENGELKVGAKSYGKVGNRAEILVTPIGISVSLEVDGSRGPWEYRGDLP